MPGGAAAGHASGANLSEVARTLDRVTRREVLQGKGFNVPPKRPASHVNADASIVKLQRAFLSVGWTVEELHKDYGEDLQVRIFDDGEATPYLFFVQSKHVVGGSRSRTKDGRYISYPFDRQHLEIWEDFTEPVILTLWDMETDQVYWEMAQSLEWPMTNRKTQQCSVRFPTDNLLDQDGLERIRARTIHRAKRLENHKFGTENLIQRLEELFEVEIEYDPFHEYLTVTLPNGEVDFTYFGRKALMMQNFQDETGLEPVEIYERLMTVALFFAASALSGIPVPVRGRDGDFEEVRGIDELLRRVTRNLELRPELVPEAAPAHVIEYLKSPDKWLELQSLIDELSPESPGLCQQNLRVEVGERVRSKLPPAVMNSDPTAPTA